MYHVRKVDFGFVFTLSGVVEATELKRWYEAACNRLSNEADPFGVLVDARACHPLSKVARFWLLRGQHACEQAGLTRAAVLVDGATQDDYWSDLTSISDPVCRVRFVDAQHFYPRVRALSWVLKGVEPNVREGNAGMHESKNASKLDERAIVDVAQP